MNLATTRRIVLLFLTTLIVLVAAYGIFSVVRLFRAPSGYVVRTSSQTVIKELKALNRLETAQFTIEKVIDAGKSGNVFQQFLFGDKILLVAHGEVIAGIDFSKLENSNIKVDGTTVRLELPEPEILVTTLNNEETRVYDRKLGLLSKGDKDLEAVARSAAEKAIRQAACQGEILNQASSNARSQLTALLKALGFTTVIISIPQASCS
ncbi:MAG: DUF4230 domain-containing protein [Candidatus Levybacteria bacterium]|nr:DUF4230 domain-containing protein [Candidatus Levybacteria bacterium]